MDKSSKSLSLANFSEMSLTARMGGLMVGVGLLALLVAAVGTGADKFLPLLLGGSFSVAAGIMAAKGLSKYKTPILISTLGAIVSIACYFYTQKWHLVPSWVLFSLGFGATSIGIIVYYTGRYIKETAGIRNDGTFHSQATKPNGVIAWILGILITGFYVLLYWYPQYLDGLVHATTPLYQVFMPGKQSNQWFLYGLLYTVAVLALGTRFIIKYRHNNYQIIRTISVMFFQLFIAFTLPYVLAALKTNDNGIISHYFTYFWPLDYDALFPSASVIADWKAQGYGGFAAFIFWWTLIASFVAVPILTYFFGKRWYCSWVCGCGGLAETAGDPFRHLSDKSLKSWQIERVLIYAILALITIITIVLLVNSYHGFLGKSVASGLKNGYGFFVGTVFSGVIGVGFYPIMGSRVWCRFGCPQAAILGILQKWFSRFRITTNGGQCISCGNCSTYCEMGIDVKWYAQRGQNIVRASCVGCGICSAVCPRGVLKLEGGPITQKTAITIDRDDVKLL